MHKLGKTSIIGFLGGLSTLTFQIFSNKLEFFPFIAGGILHWLVCQCVFSGYYYQYRRLVWKIESHVFLRAYLLGYGFSFGQLLLWTGVDEPFGRYLSILTFFHYSEFLVTSMISPSTLSLDSFLLNHSKEYGIAAAASWLEYSFESYTFPWLKSWQWPMKIGLFFCIAGELLRKGAMLTAWSNFTHLVREKRVEGHKLVTHGVYSLCRHPSYAGWFFWSIGTQLVLMNPFCTVAYTLASWKFFASRIFYEEATLLSFFGHTYFKYQHTVKRTGVPFVPGYILQVQQSSSSSEQGFGLSAPSGGQDEDENEDEKGQDHHDIDAEQSRHEQQQQEEYEEEQEKEEEENRQSRQRRVSFADSDQRDGSKSKSHSQHKDIGT